MKENSLNIKNLTKAYTSNEGATQIVLEDLNLRIEWGKNESSIFSILAPYGSGKSTLLKIMAGLENYQGECKLNDEPVEKSSRQIIFIPDKYYAFPWMSVKENIELPFRYFKNNESQKLTTNELIDLVGLKGYENFHVSSGHSGFGLRIAIARALSVKPKLILIDDALFNFDAETSQEIKDMLLSISKRIETAFLMTTTNISHAILLSKEIFLMSKNPGKIFKNIDLSELKVVMDSEIFTKTKEEIETAFKLRGIFQSLLVSV